MDTATNATNQILPILNVALLRDTVEWAVKSDRRDLFPEEQGTTVVWDQSRWAKFSTSDGNLVNEVYRNWNEGDGINRFTPIKEENVCQTAFCIAGKVVSDVGWAMLGTSMEDGSIRADYAAPRVSVGFKDGKPVYETMLDKATSISEVARGALGLHVVESTHLFSGNNSLGMILRMADVITAARWLDLGLDQRVKEVVSENSLDALDDCDSASNFKEFIKDMRREGFKDYGKVVKEVDVLDSV